MAKIKFDGVIEAVRYAQDGQIITARVYERRGASFSDVVLLGREELVKRLKNGQRFVAGKRRASLGTMFEVTAPVRLVRAAQKEILTTDGAGEERDHLNGVPLF